MNNMIKYHMVSVLPDLNLQESSSVGDQDRLVWPTSLLIVEEPGGYSGNNSAYVEWLRGQ